MTGTKTGIETPFAVEFARTSIKRAGAPTLVPIEKGPRIQAVILLIDASEDDARHLLYRREINRVGSRRRYNRLLFPVNSDLKLIQFSTKQRFKTDTPPLRSHTTYAFDAVSRLLFTIPAAR